MNIEKIKDCNNDDKCSCEALSAEQGLPLPAVYQNSLKWLRIGHCLEVLCINLQCVLIYEKIYVLKHAGSYKILRSYD